MRGSRGGKTGSSNPPNYLVDIDQERGRNNNKACVCCVCMGQMKHEIPNYTLRGKQQPLAHATQEQQKTIGLLPADRSRCCCRWRRQKMGNGRVGNATAADADGFPPSTKRGRMAKWGHTTGGMKYMPDIKGRAGTYRTW